MKRTREEDHKAAEDAAKAAFEALTDHSLDSIAEELGTAFLAVPGPGDEAAVFDRDGKLVGKLKPLPKGKP